MLLGLADTLIAPGCFDDVFMISGLNGDGVEDLKRHLAAVLPPGPWLFPEDQLSDAPQRWLAAEVTREQVFLQLHDELPYAATVETEAWEERPRRQRADRPGDLCPARRASAPSCSASKGQRIKAIGARARAELERMLDRRVHLFLFVKVRDELDRGPRALRGARARLQCLKRLSQQSSPARSGNSPRATVSHRVALDPRFSRG